jgi:cytochrome c-type biogenesis protein CcmH/NrfF
MSRRNLFPSVIAAVVLFAALSIEARPARAIEEAPAWAYAMAHDLMSPYCPGRTLAECPSPQATELRFWILTQGAAGVSEEEVRVMLNERFGDVLLSAPRAEGWGFSAYAIPIVFFVLGGPVVFLILRRISRGGAPSPALGGSQGDPSGAVSGAAGTATETDDELELQLERELGEL